MITPHGVLTSEAIQMIVASVTQQGSNQLSELEAERLLNAITRAQTGTPTGTSKIDVQ